LRHKNTKNTASEATFESGKVTITQLEPKTDCRHQGGKTNQVQSGHFEKLLRVGRRQAKTGSTVGR